MIVKFIIDNHDVIRESSNSVLLRIGADKFCWVPKQFIELFDLVQQSKVLAPDDMQFNCLSGDINKIWVLEKKDNLTNLGNKKITEIKEMYYKWINYTL